MQITFELNHIEWTVITRVVQVRSLAMFGWWKYPNSHVINDYCQFMSANIYAYGDRHGRLPLSHIIRYGMVTISWCNATTGIVTNSMDQVWCIHSVGYMIYYTNFWYIQIGVRFKFPILILLITWCKWVCRSSRQMYNIVHSTESANQLISNKNCAPQSLDLYFSLNRKMSYISADILWVIANTYISRLIFTFNRNSFVVIRYYWY